MKSAVKRDGPKAPTAVYGHLGFKANTIACYLEISDLWYGNHKRGLEARVQALLEAVADTPLEK
jgi:hypothetical protein